MKKLKLVGMLAAVVMLMFIVVASYLSEKNVDEPEELFVVPVTRDELFISSEEEYNSIEIYKQENKLVINAQSEAAFFDGVQFTVEIEAPAAILLYPILRKTHSSQRPAASSGSPAEVPNGPLPAADNPRPRAGRSD